MSNRFYFKRLDFPSKCVSEMEKMILCHLTLFIFPQMELPFKVTYWKNMYIVYTCIKRIYGIEILII